MTIPSEQQLLEAACHIGHRSFKWCPKMKPYLYGTRKGIHMFDLTQTRSYLEKTCKELQALQQAGRTILFVSTKQHSTQLLEELGTATGHPVVTKKWIPGLLTNWKTISRRIKYYLDLQKSFQSGEVEKYTKKEQLQLRKKLAKLDNALSGVSQMTDLPHAIFVVDAVRDRIAIQEAKTIGIPVYGICDSNADPDAFSVIVPANDDAIASVRLVLETVQDCLGNAPQEEEKAEAVAEKASEPATAAA